MKMRMERRILTALRKSLSALTTAWIGARETARRRTHPQVWERSRTQYAQRLQSYLGQDTSAKATTVTGDATLLFSLRHRTAQENVNNLTRTAAYLRMYLAHPELHWALLAHLVSRNGGWNMTDLRGDVVRPVLTKEVSLRYFAFLERCNYLIFHDAYPQLLLYEESKKRGTPLFDLLPGLGVSIFMRTAWETFWEERKPGPLVTAQIVNEQSYIERRVVQSPAYGEIFSEPSFCAQSLFHLVSVFFPAQGASGGAVRLYGNRVRDFTSLTERIAVGKSLYALLFPRTTIRRSDEPTDDAAAVAAVSSGPVAEFLHFAKGVPHTGSRADYLPDFFSRHPQSGRLYSPTLQEAWPDAAPAPVESGDWCSDLTALQWIAPSEPPWHPELTESYRKRLLWLQKGANAIGPALRS